MKYLPFFSFLLLVFLSCGETEDLTPNCQVSLTNQDSGLYLMLQTGSYEWPGPIADSPDTLEICQHPVNGAAVLTNFNEVQYQPNIVSGLDSFITKRYKVSPSGTTIETQKHRFRIYENAESRCLDVLTNTVDTVRETIKVSADQSVDYRSHPVLWYCKASIQSFTSTLDPTHGEVSLDTTSNYPGIYYINSTTAQAGLVDIFHLELCIDTGMITFCKKTVHEYTYVN